MNMVKEASGRDSPAEWSEPADGGATLALRLRLSCSARDRDLRVGARHTIAHCKAELHAQEGIEPWRQRWFYGGKLLADRLLVEEAKITPGYVVQVIVSTDPHPPS
ncbi:unnamed protein product [Parnassius apollo]|uniref:(apollo) hypothetical protein n=1 Tax=Parnassius apollo TaxID=110799 RepID=A0A8S3Y9F6_PARAO|nr:unnamed protein product [Parnassius apollo]